MQLLGQEQGEQGCRKTPVVEKISDFRDTKTISLQEFVAYRTSETVIFFLKNRF